MKSRFPTIRVLFGVATILCIIYFTSCYKQGVKNEVTKQTNSAVRQKDSVDKSASFGAACYFSPCIVEFYCTSSGFCYVLTRYCVPQQVVCPWLNFPQCRLVDCGDPWAWRDRFIYPMPSFRNLFQLGSKPSFVPIRFTPDLAILQFYSEIQGTLDSKTLKLPKGLDLPKDVAQNLGLKGNAILPGTYPVIFDEKTKTLNAIVKIK